MHDVTHGNGIDKRRKQLHCSVLALAIATVLLADGVRAENATGGGAGGENSASGRPGGAGNGWGGRGSVFYTDESPVAATPVEGNGSMGTASPSSGGAIGGWGGAVGTTAVSAVTGGGSVSGQSGSVSSGQAGGGGGGAGAFLTDAHATITAVIAGGRGGNGGPGSGGGGGGAGLMLVGETISQVRIAAAITGGSGGEGGGENGVGGYGGGGGGGAGVVLQATDPFARLVLTNEGHVSGGAGGKGGGSGDASGGGGGGGAGIALVGTGILLENAANATISGGRSGWNDRLDREAVGGSGVWVNGIGASITNEGNIIGGAGHSAGPASTHGGVGLNAASAGAVGTSLRNTGGIVGGNAGSGDGTGGAGIVANGAQITHAGGFIAGGRGIGTGAGGVGISGSDLSIVANHGISGGLAGNNVTRADALSFTGGNNALTLQPGWWLQGNIAINDGTLAFHQVTPVLLSNAITGNGAVVKVDAGTLVLTGAQNTYSGLTTIAAGTLRTDANDTLSAQSAHRVEAPGTLDLQGFDQRIARLDNAGMVRLGGAPGTTLTVTGDYVGQGGVLALNVALGADGASTDRLVVEGNTSGTTALHIANVGGAGAATADGIRVVRVDGASDGTFEQATRVVGGAYDYFLHHGSRADPEDGHWYLRSERMASGEPPSAEAPAGAVLRPETGAYLLNQATVRTLLQHSMHDRVGGAAGAAWVRFARSEADYTALDAQLDVDTEVSLLHVGTDLFGGERGQFGAMLSAGKVRNRAIAIDTGYLAKGRVTGAAVGLYGSWIADPVTAGGLYLDSWVQYADNRHRVQGQGLAEEHHGARTLAGSLEAGYAWKLGPAVRIEPQLHATWFDYRADVHVESSGTVVQAMEAGGWSTRAGVRVGGHGSRARVQPFATFNWLRDDGDDAVAFDGIALVAGTPRDRRELKVGVQAELGPGWTGWSQFGLQEGDDDYRQASGQVGLKRTW